MPTEPTGRRPLKSRDLPIFKNLAAWLARAGVKPNMISAASIAFGCLAGTALAATAQCDCWATRWLWLGAAVFIQLRLIANLLDGMVAVEGRKGGPTGDLWNEAPDRVSDTAIFIGAGYAAGSVPVLGWAAALMAVFVAYVRALGASVGAGQCFLGPMAKPQRMALMTVICFLLTVFPDAFITESRTTTATFGEHGSHSRITTTKSRVGIICGALALVILGGGITATRRLQHIAKFLRSKPRP